MADRELIEAARQGDERALARLIETCRPDLRRYAGRTCAADDVDDGIQDALVILSRSLASLRTVAALSSWLYQVVKRACLRRWRRRGLAGADPEAAAPERDPADPDLRLDLSRAIQTLPPLDRAIVVFRDIEGWTAEEAAEAVGISTEAVKSRLHRARFLIRKQLA